MMYWYQIDCRSENGELENTDFVKAASLDAAVTAYLEGVLGHELEPFAVTRERVNSKTVVTARCPAWTSAYWEFTRCAR
jgi:hypothetical protein